MRTTWSLLAFVALLPFATACYMRSPHATYGNTTQLYGQGVANWLRYAPAPEVAFVCELPAQPAVENRVDEQSGLHFTMATAHDPSGVVVAVAIAEHDGQTEDAERTLDGLRDALVRSLEGTLRGEQPFVAGAFPGRALTIDLRARPVRFETRVYVGRNHVYAAFVGGDGYANSRGQGAIQRFFASVQLDPNDAPDLVGDGRLTDAPLESWSWWQPAGADFAVRAPGAMRLRRVMRPTSVGERPTQLFELTREGSGEQLRVVVSDFERRPPRGIFEEVRRAAEGQRLRFVDARATVLRGFAARVMRFEHPQTGQRAESLLVVTNARLYEARALTPRGDAAAEQRARAFLDSFKVF